MCGIFGIVTDKNQKIGQKLLIGGQGLSYRGYDSVGCATIANQKIVLRKNVGKIETIAKKLKFNQMTGQRGIIQLRWATFGAPSKTNAQPHYGCQKTIIGAHNGNIVNNIFLREKLLKSGHRVRSTNDGESCVHAFDHYFLKGKSPLQSLRQAYQLLEGDYAYVITTTQENKLYAVKKGSSLYAGYGHQETYLSSDLPSLLPFTNQILYLNDDEAIILSPEKIEVFNIKTGKKLSRQPKIVKESIPIAQKAGYPHFYLKEVNEQPQAARDLIDLLNASKYVKKFLVPLKKAQRVYLVGCGTSYHAAFLGAYFFSSLAKKQVFPVLAPQFLEQFAPHLNRNDAVVFISQSGETKDILNAVKVIKKKKCPILAIINILGSTLMNQSDVYLPLACGYEKSVAATKTFMNQIILFLYLATVLGKKNPQLLNRLPNLIKKTISQTQKPAQKIAKKLKSVSDLYCLGYGISQPIALEGALKIKEITYSHCEGMLSSEFKHGPLTAVQKNYPVIFVSAPQDEKAIINHINEVTCRQGLTISISEPSKIIKKSVAFKIDLPKSNQEFFPLLAIIPLQLIAYYWSITKGIDPDFPRNISKTLTVD